MLGLLRGICYRHWHGVGIARLGGHEREHPPAPLKLLILDCPGLDDQVMDRLLPLNATCEDHKNRRGQHRDDQPGKQQWHYAKIHEPSHRRAGTVC